MIVQPALEFLKQVSTLGASAQTLLEPSYDIAALMLGHRTEPQHLAREDLMIDERASPGFDRVRSVPSSEGSINSCAPR